VAIRASDFTLDAVRLAVFPTDQTTFNSSAMLAALLPEVVSRYDGDVHVLPYPADFRPEAPRILLASKDQRWAFAAAPLQINSSWDRREKGDGPTPDPSAIVAECLKPVLVDVRKHSLRVCRLGLVLGRVCYEEQPSATLLERFCKADVFDAAIADAPFRRSANFEIHNHKRYVFQNVTINSWVRFRTGTGESAPGITLEQDINTLNEDVGQNDFDADSIKEFFSYAVPEMDATLRKCFP
jgi:hypothetical protein